MRSKEESADYRYFPDPDLPPVLVEERWIQEVRGKMPLLPEQHITRLVDTFGLTPYDAGVLTAEASHVRYFDEVLEICGNAKLACNWVTSELFGLLNKEGLTIEKSPVTAKNLGELLKLIESETISGKMAKGVFEEMFATSSDPHQIVEKKGLKQITDDSAIIAVVEAAFDENPSQLAEYLGGNERLHPYFVGQVMKRTGGAANPKKVNDLIKATLAKRKA
jgi:aspartyl-tRNA(Asn)/glutamyl-tRNA(Gln) amidotransferase subunit B